MTEAEAREIVSWRYEAPLDVYGRGMDGEEEAVAELVEPGNLYLAVTDEDDNLIAYLCYGEKARAGGIEYSGDALDVFGAARPDLVGTGFGEMFVRAAVDFGTMFFRPGVLRASVGAFNERAIRVCEKAGFERAGGFGDGGSDVVILTRSVEL